MEQEKHYWVLFKWESSIGGKGEAAEIFEVHPLSRKFKQENRERNHSRDFITVLNWKELSDEEYKLSLFS